MKDQIISAMAFIISLCGLVYFIQESWRAYVSTEFKRDMARLREQRRLRRAARRKR
jgi:hypothetical protein